MCANLKTANLYKKYQKSKKNVTILRVFVKKLQKNSRHPYIAGHLLNHYHNQSYLIPKGKT